MYLVSRLHTHVAYQQRYMGMVQRLEQNKQRKEKRR